MSIYSKWIEENVLAPRTPADVQSVDRALNLVFASLRQIPDQELRAKLNKKLMLLPVFERTLQKNKELRDRIPFVQSVRTLFKDVSVVGQLYIEAVTLALTEGVAELITLQGETLTVTRASSTLDNLSWPTVVYSRKNSARSIKGDWRENVLVADQLSLEDFFTRQPLDLEMNTQQRMAFAKEIANLAPDQRLDAIDARTRMSPEYFYDEIFAKLRVDVIPDLNDFLPDNPSIFDALAVRSSASQTEADAQRLLEMLPWNLAFDRFSAFPSVIPSIIFEKFMELPKSEQHAAMRACFARARTPIAAFHALRLYGMYAPHLLDRMVSIFIRRSATQYSEIRAYLFCAKWFANELSRRETLKSRPAWYIIAVAWAHTHQLLLRLHALRFTFADFADTLPMKEDLETIVMADADYKNAAGHPRQVDPAVLILCALSNSSSRDRFNLGKIDEAYLQAIFMRNDPYVLVDRSLYGGGSGNPSVFETYFDSDYAERLHVLLENQFSETYMATFTSEALRNAVQEARTDGNWWRFISIRLHANDSLDDGFIETIFAETKTFEWSSDTLDSGTELLKSVTLIYSRKPTQERGLAAEAFWEKAVSHIIDDREATQRHSNALIFGASNLACVKDEPSLRLQAFLGYLRHLLLGQAGVRDSVFMIANGLRSRLNARDIDSNLSDLLLQLRARA